MRLQKSSEQVSGPLSQADFVRITEISMHQIYTKFPEGGWSEVKQVSGLAFHPQGKPLSDDDLLNEYHRVVSILGDIPTLAVFNDKATISADVISRRFGRSKGIVKKYIEWLKINYPDSPLLQRIKVKEKSSAQIKELPITKLSSKWKRGDGPWTSRASVKDPNSTKFQQLLEAVDLKGIIPRRKKRPLMAVKLHFGEKGNTCLHPPDFRAPGGGRAHEDRGAGRL